MKDLLGFTGMISFDLHDVIVGTNLPYITLIYESRFLPNRLSNDRVINFTEHERRALTEEIARFISTTAKEIQQLNLHMENIIADIGSVHVKTFYQQIVSSLLNVSSSQTLFT
jgi:hypothetical protein